MNGVPTKVARRTILRSSITFGIFVIAHGLLFPLTGRSASSEDGKKSKIEWETTLEAARKEGEVSIYGPSNRDEQKALVDAFLKAHPQIKVQYISGRLSEIVSRIMAERRAERYMVDVLLGSTTIPNRSLKPGGVLEPIRPALILPEVLNTSAWFKKTLVLSLEQVGEISQETV